MPFSFLDFTADPSTINITDSCDDLPCNSGVSVTLKPELEVKGNPQFNVTYTIKEDVARFCENGESEIHLLDVSADEAGKTVQFCRTENLGNKKEISVEAKVTEIEGDSDERTVIIIVASLKPEGLRGQTSNSPTSQPTSVSLDLFFGLPESREEYDGLVQFSLAKKANFRFEVDGKSTRKVYLDTRLKPSVQWIQHKVVIRKNENVVGSDTKKIRISASLYIKTGVYLGRRRCVVDLNADE